MLTYQDFEVEQDRAGFLTKAINEHMASEEYLLALDADEYDKQRNVTINNYVQVILTAYGEPVVDITATNSKLASNFFHRLNTQRCTYSLGNGVSFVDHVEKVVDETGIERLIDRTKEKLGNKFDTDLKKVGYKALIHGVCFGFWNVDRLHVFPLTQFVPFWDEETGALRAGIRFWRLDPAKPMTAVLYTEDGYTKYMSGDKDMDFVAVDEKPRPYRTITARTVADGEYIVGEMNYGSLPIVPLWGSDLHQSTLVGMREKIDSFDLIRSGFANDLTDCTQIYWILENYGGMSAEEQARWRDKLKITHIAVADTDNGKITPYTQEVPYQARQAYLDSIRAGIYEDFGALDVHTVAAGATNDHIDAAYQPMDENADDFEYQIIEFVQQVLRLMGIEDTPQFKRNRVSNQKEQTDMVLSAAEYLDQQTILQKLPFVTVDEVQDILARRDAEGQDRLDDSEDNNLEEIEVVEETEEAAS